VPQLAAAMPSLSADKKTMTIRIRQGVRFNDGTPLNAQAVKVSLDRHRTLRGSARASEISPISSVEVAGPYLVRLHLTDRFSPLTAQLADRAGMIMSPKQLDALGDRFASNPSSTSWSSASSPIPVRGRRTSAHTTSTCSTGSPPPTCLRSNATRACAS
jgi:peptide/nickel transport system substrate-binding protein